MNLRVAVAGEVKGLEACIRSERRGGNAFWRSAPISVEKLPDEMRVGVKGQSNPEIARTPRNAFRCSPCLFRKEVERPIGCEGFAAYQVLTNSECLVRLMRGVRARVLRSAS